jgi:uncharacterized protein (DUF2384 family)
MKSQANRRSTRVPEELVTAVAFARGFIGGRHRLTGGSLALRKHSIRPIRVAKPDLPAGADVVSEARKRIIRQILGELSVKDRLILRGIFLEEADKSTVSERFQVSRDYVRVLVHKTKLKFRAALNASSCEATAPNIDRLMATATKVIGNREEALRWMGTPVRALGFSTPVSLLTTPEGVAQVLQVLNQLQHGVM